MTSAPVFVHCSAGRRGAGSIDCRVCGTRIHQRPDDPAWYDGDGQVRDLDESGLHAHTPAAEVGPTLGPFEYAELTYDTLRVDDGEILATWSVARGDWLLTDAAGEAAGEAYSDLTITTRSS